MTECEYTVYHFEIPPAHFRQGLDIFAQVIWSSLCRPLMMRIFCCSTILSDGSVCEASC
jgi:hypothetical protein